MLRSKVNESLSFICPNESLAPLILFILFLAKIKKTKREVAILLVNCLNANAWAVFEHKESPLTLQTDRVSACENSGSTSVSKRCAKLYVPR